MLKHAVDVDALLDGVEAHEGFGTEGQGNGHEAQARAAASDPANDIYAFTEGLVRESRQDLTDAVIVQGKAMQNRIAAAGSVQPTGNWSGKWWESDTTASKGNKYHFLNQTQHLNLVPNNE